MVIIDGQAEGLFDLGNGQIRRHHSMYLKLFLPSLYAGRPHADLELGLAYCKISRLQATLPYCIEPVP